MYNEYFKDWEVRPDFEKGFVSLWPFWLGKDNLHKLDEVPETEWRRFNNWISLVAEGFTIKVANCDSESTLDFKHNDLSSYEESMNKDGSLFSKFIFSSVINSNSL